MFGTPEEMEQMKQRMLKRSATLKENYVCKICEDTHYVRLEGDAEKVPCICQREVIRSNRLKDSGLELRIKKNTFAKYEGYTPEIEAMKEMCIEYLRNLKSNNFETNILLTGQAGSGKTHLAVATCMKIIQEHDVIYINYVEFIKLRFQQLQGIYQQELDKVKKVKILFIDDLFMNFDKSKDQAIIKMFYEIINYRYNNDLGIIITSNSNLDELLDIHEATVSRIVEKTKCKTTGQRYFTELEGKEFNYRLRL